MASYLLTEDGSKLLLEGGEFIALESSSGGSAFLLLEDGGYILLEDGSKILLEVATAESFLLLEDGGYILLESGDKILLEVGGEGVVEVADYIIRFRRRRR